MTLAKELLFAMATLLPCFCAIALDTDGDGLSDEEETGRFAAWIVPKSRTSSQFIAEWAGTNFNDCAPMPVLDVCSSSTESTVLYTNGVAETRRYWSEPCTYYVENVAKIVGGDHQTIYIDKDGGFLAAWDDAFGVYTGSHFFVYCGNFGEMPVDVKGDNGHAIALFADGTVTNVGAFAQGNFGCPGFSDAGQLDVNVPGTLLSISTNCFRYISAFTTPATTEDAPSNVVRIASSMMATRCQTASGESKAWGRDSLGELETPEYASDAVALTGDKYGWGVILSDGSVRSWGGYGDCTNDTPLWVTNAVAIVGGETGYSALLEDGSRVAWGYCFDGEELLEDVHVVDTDMRDVGFWDLFADGTMRVDCMRVAEPFAIDLRESFGLIDKPAFSFNYGYFYGGAVRLALNTSPLLPDTDGDGLEYGELIPHGVSVTVFDHSGELEHKWIVENPSGETTAFRIAKMSRKCNAISDKIFSVAEEGVPLRRNVAEAICSRV